MKQQSKKLQNPKEKVSKYLANIGFASRRGIANLFSEKTIFLNGKKAKQADLLADVDTLTIDGEDHIVDLSPETEVLIYHKPTGQVSSNVPTEKNDSVFHQITKQPLQKLWSGQNASYKNCGLQKTAFLFCLKLRV